MAVDDVEVVLVEPRGGGGSRVRMVSFKADAGLIMQLDELARRTGRSRSEVIRRAIEVYIMLSKADAPSPRYMKPVEPGAWRR